MDWLNIVKTQQARSKIKQFFKKELRGENITRGKSMLEHEAKRRGAKLSDINKPEYYGPLLKKYSFSDMDSLYGAVGYGAVTSVYVISQLIEEQKKQIEASSEEKQAAALPKPQEVMRHGKPTSGVYVEEGAGMLVRFAHCCNPVPGDEIAGYVTRGRGVTVHKADCANIINSEPERKINVSWAEEELGEFNAKLRIIATTTRASLGEITVYVSMPAPCYGGIR